MNNYVRAMEIGLQIVELRRFRIVWLSRNLNPMLMFVQISGLFNRAAKPELLLQLVDPLKFLKGYFFHLAHYFRHRTKTTILEQQPPKKHAALNFLVSQNNNR